MSQTAAPASNALPASVVIPTHNRPASLARCLRALSAQLSAPDFEVVVVDNGSDPPLDTPVVRGLPRARLLRTDFPGPGPARNRGWRTAAGEVVLFTDDDTEPGPEWVAAACAFLAERRDHVGVEGPVSSPPWDPLREHSLENGRPGAYWTCNLAFRRDALVRLDGFDERLAYHCEDMDLAFRALRLGPIGFEPRMRITHHPRRLSARQMILRGRLTSNEIALFSAHREHFGRASRLPPRLFPVASAVAAWGRLARDEGWHLVRSPSRGLRFLAIAAGYLANVLVATATATPIEPGEGEPRT
jgi:GT2 family glycosyltransferase